LLMSQRDTGTNVAQPMGNQLTSVAVDIRVKTFYHVKCPKGFYFTYI
jgi:hypothetical protein